MYLNATSDGLAKQVTASAQYFFFFANVASLLFFAFAVTPFDLESAIKLDVLYSMERDKIPVLTELTKNKKIRSIICSETTEADLKWPTFTKPSIHKPTWENLISFLKLAKQNDLIKRIKRYLKKMKGKVIHDDLIGHVHVRNQ